MRNYLNLVEKIINEGVDREDRTEQEQEVF